MRWSSRALLPLVLTLACADPEGTDAGPFDAAAVDGGADTGPRDTGLDAGPRDSGPDASVDAAVDATVADADPMDATPTDAVSSDAANLDADLADADPADADPLDALPTDLAPVSTSTSIWSAADGTPDTACTPWILVDSATPEDPVLAGSALTISTSADAENIYYYQPETDLITPAILRFGARLRFVSGTDSTPSRAPAFIGFTLGVDRKKNALFIRDGVVFLLASENVEGPTVSMATTDAPHDYLLVVDLSTGAIEVFRDGASILIGATYPNTDPAAVPSLSFGEGSLFANGTSEWYGVAHNAHSPTTCP